MSVQFLSTPEALLREFESLCDCADEIRLCTTAIEGVETAGHPWPAIVRNLARVRSVFVPERGADRVAARRLHEMTALRFISDPFQQFRTNLYLFSTGDVVQALVGAPALIGAGFRQPVPAVLCVEGTRDDEFVCGLLEFFRQLQLSARVSHVDELAADDAAPGATSDAANPPVPFVLPVDGELALLADAASATAAIGRLEAALRDVAEPRVARIGDRPWGEQEILWSSQVGLWAAFSRTGSAVGIELGSRVDGQDGRVAPSVVLSIPLGADLREHADGIAIEAGTNRLLLLDRGPVGGVCEGIAPEEFWRVARSRRVELRDGSQFTPAALVAELDARNTVEQLAAYVHEVERVRRAIAGEAAPSLPAGGQVAPRRRIPSVAWGDAEAAVVYEIHGREMAGQPMTRVDLDHFVDERDGDVGALVERLFTEGILAWSKEALFDYVGAQPSDGETARLTATGSALPRYPPDHGARARDEQRFFEMTQDEQIELVHGYLLGRGALHRDDAVREAARCLREDGLVAFQRLRTDGPLYDQIYSVLKYGVRTDLFDKPRANYLRAVLADRAVYPDILWQRCLLATLEEGQPIERDELVRMAADWAVESLGLEHQRLRSGGTVDTGLRKAITACLRRGLLTAVGRTMVQRTARSPSDNE